MRTHTNLFLTCAISLLVLLSATGSEATARVYVRYNQEGYAPSDQKELVLQSNNPLESGEFQLLTPGADLVMKGVLGPDEGAHLAFAHHRIADISSAGESGRYYLRYAGELYGPIRIGEDLYDRAPGMMLDFFKVQRCGSADARWHETCHIKDATSVKELDVVFTRPNLIGGWHDAGDYIKFLVPTAHAVYFLLLTWEHFPSARFDRDGNGQADLIDEALIGVRWLRRMRLEEDQLAIQVADARDHSAGFRMPSEDQLANDRPVYGPTNQVTCASFASALAVAGRVLKQVPGQADLARECLADAVEVFELAHTDIPEGSSGPDGMYADGEAEDNLALAAAELYRSTGRNELLQSALRHVENVPVTGWISWGDLNNLAHARMAEYRDASLEALEDALSNNLRLAGENPFGYPLEHYPWGSTMVQTGIAALAIMHHDLSGSDRFLPLVYQQRDFLLGSNSHGVSFIVGMGQEYPKNIHHQIAYITKRLLAGAVVGGYADPDILERVGIQHQGWDRYKRFQSDRAVYYDDRFDYVCNEPTIAGNAQAVYLFSWLQSR